MTLKLIDDIFLYTSNKAENLLSSLELISWIDHTNILYTSLQYPNLGILEPLNTWWVEDIDTGITQEPLVDFPFVVYTEIHEDHNIKFKKYIFGKENIIATLPVLYSLGR